MRILAIGDDFVDEQVFAEGLSDLSNVAVRTARIHNRQPGSAGNAANVREYVGRPADVAAMIGDAEVLLVHAAPVTADVLDAAPNLRVVGVARGGPVNVDVDAASARGIPVLNAPGRNAEAVAELTLWLMIGVARRVKVALAATRPGSPVGESVIEGARFLGQELAGRTLGLVGFGRVGTRVAQLAAAVGMAVLAYDPYVPRARIEAYGASPRELTALLGASDFVSLHARATRDGSPLLGASEFSTMRRGSFLINAARESLIDEAALLEALASGHLAGAALDVIEPHPEGGNPLLDREDVIVLPHIGGATREASLNGVMILADGLARFRGGESVESVVNPEVLAESTRRSGPVSEELR